MSAAIAHYSSQRKREVRTALPKTTPQSCGRKPRMPKGQKPGYDPAKVRASVREQVSAAKKRLGLNNEELATKAGLTSNTLGKFYRGGTDSPTLATAMQVAHACGIPLGQLVGEAPQAPASAVSSDELRRAVANVRRILAAHTSEAEEAMAELAELTKRLNELKR